MALRGTLGDFGIADIFQLVGHQTKTGILLLKNREVEVRIYFVEGNVVKAEQSSRDKRDLLGNLMVRAGALTDEQLEDALNQQQRTLRRLGHILVDSGYVDRRTLKDFTRLQTTETIYRLFQWDAGTYEFRQETVDYDEESYDPIRAETILMEGFRMVDEWPAVRKVIPSSSVTFTRKQELPPQKARSEDDDDDFMAGLDAAFGEGDDDDDDDSDVGSNERAVYALAEPERVVEAIVDRSRLGEFETCKALANLVRAGYLEAHVPEVPEASAERVPLTPRALVNKVLPVLTRVALYVVVAASVGGVIKLLELDDTGLFARDRERVVRPGEMKRVLGEIEKARLTRAVEVYRLVEGRYPARLEDLVAAGLVSARDLRFPYRTEFAYRATPEAASLALPLR